LFGSSLHQSVAIFQNILRWLSERGTLSGEINVERSRNDIQPSVTRYQ
jgi:hypothetical protein